MTTELEKVVQQIAFEYGNLSLDADKVVIGGHGSKAAGARSRKATLHLEKLLKQYRKLSIAEEARAENE